MSGRHLIITMLPLLLGAFTAGAQDLAALVEQNEQAVVVLTGVRSDTGAEVQSSGCCIHTDGYILTTAHQIVGVKDLKARTVTGETMTVDVVEAEKSLELALLKAERHLPVAAEIGGVGTLRSGASIFCISTPQNLDFSVVPGVISSTNRTLNDHPVLQADLRVSPGSSGGPVFDNRGTLVGLIIGKLQTVEWVTVVNPVDNAYPMLARHKLYTPPQSGEQGKVRIPEAGVSDTERSALEAYNAGVAVADPLKKAEHYARALSLLPDFYQAQFNRAVALEAADKPGEAAEAYKKAQALKPDALEVHRNLGRLYLRDKQPGAAIEHFQQAVALEPDSAQSYNDLGEAHRQLEHWAEAQQAFGRALELRPQYAQAHYNLALVLAARADAAEAVKHFEAYLEHAQEAPDVAQVREWIADLKQKKP
jgi:Flp pilus assembly protein TadD